MSIKVGKYSFDGAHTSASSLEDRSGVYAVHCKRDDKYYLVDAGESATVKTRVENHDRKACWSSNCTGTITYAAYYTPNMQQPGRKAIEKEIRNQYNPPCGKE